MLRISGTFAFCRIFVNGILRRIRLVKTASVELDVTQRGKGSGSVAFEVFESYLFDAFTPDFLISVHVLEMAKYVRWIEGGEASVSFHIVGV